MTREQVIQSIVQLGQAALEEMQNAPPGSAAAIGDGTLLKLFLEMLPILLEILNKLPT